MSRKLYARARRRKGFNAEKAEFYEFFARQGASPNEDLWRIYQEWRRMNREREFYSFLGSIKDAYHEARRQLEEWPNPFKNARKGEMYTLSFQFPSCVADYKIVGLKQLNLSATKDEHDRRLCSITGVPNMDGEFEVKCYCLWKGARERKDLTKEEKILVRSFTLRVNPDPREMWKDVPTDPDIEYYKADCDSREVRSGQWRMVGASRRGRSHAHTGLPRDDDFGLACFNGWSMLAVADGAGSAPFSRKGSAIACETALNACRAQLAALPRLDEIFNGLNPASDSWKSEAYKVAYSVLPHAAFEAYKAIKKEAQERGREAKNYATTLLLAMTKKFPAGWIVMSFQVGDGAMALLTKSGSLKKSELLAEPDEGEYGGQTRFITMKDIFTSESLMQRLRINLAPDLKAVILMSDGVSDAKFSALDNLRSQSHWADFWFDLGQPLASADPGRSLLEWLQFWSQGNHDDRTIAVMFRDQPLAIGVNSNLKNASGHE